MLTAEAPRRREKTRTSDSRAIADASRCSDSSAEGAEATGGLALRSSAVAAVTIENLRLDLDCSALPNGMRVGFNAFFITARGPKAHPDSLKGFPTTPRRPSDPG